MKIYKNNNIESLWFEALDLIKVYILILCHAIAKKKLFLQCGRYNVHNVEIKGML